jgi:hypothetical protein
MGCLDRRREGGSPLPGPIRAIAGCVWGLLLVRSQLALRCVAASRLGNVQCVEGSLG